MLKVVVDTNQFVNSVIGPQGLPRELINAWQQREFILLAPPAIVDTGLQRPVRAPFTHRDGATQFRLRLAPAEGTLLEIHGQ